MRKYLIERHFINGEPTFEEYVKGIDNIISALDISRSKDYGFEFGLKLTVDGNKLDKEFQERIIKETSRLSSNIRILYDSEDRGPGTSSRQILFNSDFCYNPGIIIDVNLDQYCIDTEESLEQLLELTRKVENDNALYAIGSRDVPVILATNQRNSDIRIIHELFHSLIIGSDKLKVDEENQNATPAYAEIGESTSGLTMINSSHLMYPKLARNVFDSAQRANMNGFATDYYVSIKSSQLGNIAKGYVRSKTNKFYENPSEQEEFESVKGLISGQTRELGKTDIRDLMIEGLKERKNKKRISEFYPKDDVELVQGIMLEALDICV